MAIGWSFSCDRVDLVSEVLNDPRALLEDLRRFRAKKSDASKGIYKVKGSPAKRSGKVKIRVGKK